MVYYVNEAASRFNVETSAIDGLSETVTLTPPAALSEGYPEFVRGRGNFVAAIKGQDKAKLITEAEWDAESGKVLVSIQPRDDDARKAFFEAACKDETELELGAADTTGRSPLVAGKTAKIERQTNREDCGSTS